MIRTTLVALAATLAFAQPTYAQISEVRGGVSLHDIDWTGLGSGDAKERSVAINAEVLFETPDFLDWAARPKPYVHGTLNLEGNTSYGGAGLVWRQAFGERLYSDFAFGLAAHDGNIQVEPSALVQSVFDNPALAGELTVAQLAQFNLDEAAFLLSREEERDYGSRVLFRQQITLGYRLSDKWAAEIFAEHLSNGKILVQDRPNEGLDTIGIKAARRF